MADKFLSTMRRIPHWVIVLVLLALGAVLAITSLAGDSITFDETAHLVTGYSYLKTGDFRLSFHLPLAKVWCAAPLLFIDNQWPVADENWRRGDFFTIGKTWLFDLNDGERMLIFARCMMVILLLATQFCIYLIGKQLFGRRAGLFALLLSVFSPTFLAHGRLVTTDLSLTLVALLTLLAFGRLFEKISLGRLIAAAFALSALSLTKVSWVLVLPAVVVMGLVAIFSKEPIRCKLFWRKQPAGKEGNGSDALFKHRLSKFAVTVVAFAISGVVVWLSIWTFYGWRYSPFLGEDREEALMYSVPSEGQALPTTMEQTWEVVMTDREGKQRHGPVVSIIRLVRNYRLLPESYIYAVAYTVHSTLWHSAYLLGKTLKDPSVWYFPIAFAIKTPLSVIFLFAAGITSVFAGLVPMAKRRILMAGFVSFAVIYGLVAITSSINIGHRHILPLYPAIMVFGGASAELLNRRCLRWFIGLAVAWLIIANLWIHPHYLAYFNELVGGPGRGHLYLADSNIDWGQDIKRLAKYAKEHPHETIKLSYLGSGDPSKYGFECEQLRSVGSLEDFGKPAELSAGTYVVSISQLLGIYDMFIDNEFWQNWRNIEVYRRMHNILSVPLSKDATEQERLEREKLAERYYQVQQARLINRLRHRQPDERIGYSLFVYRLSQEDVDLLIQP